MERDEPGASGVGSELGSASGTGVCAIAKCSGDSGKGTPEADVALHTTVLAEPGRFEQKAQDTLRGTAGESTPAALSCWPQCAESLSSDPRGCRGAESAAQE